MEHVDWLTVQKRPEQRSHYPVALPQLRQPVDVRPQGVRDGVARLTMRKHVEHALLVGCEQFVSNTEPFIGDVQEVPFDRPEVGSKLGKDGWIHHADRANSGS